LIKRLTPSNAGSRPWRDRPAPRWQGRRGSHQPGGFSPGLAARLGLDDGPRSRARGGRAGV